MTTPAAPRHNEPLAVAVAVVASIAVGTVPYLARSLQTSGVDTVSLLFVRYMVGVVVLLAIGFARRESLVAGGLRPAFTLYGLGLFAAVQTFLYYTAIETVATSIAVTVFFAYPLFTLIADRYVHRLAISRWTVLSIVAILLGVAATSLPNLAGARADRHGLMLIAMTPLLYAIYIASAYVPTRQVPTFAAASLLYLGQLTAFTIGIALGGLVVPSTAAGWAAAITIGTIGGAFQIAGFTYALPRLSASGYAVIVSLELVTVVLIGVALLGERLSPVQLVGIALVLGGVVLDRLQRARSAR